MKKAIHFIVKLLLVIGALNWGLVGFFHYNVVTDLFSGMSEMGARIIYDIIGLAGLYSIACLCRCCKSSCKCGPNCNCGCCNKGNKRDF